MPRRSGLLLPLLALTLSLGGLASTLLLLPVGTNLVLGSLLLTMALVWTRRQRVGLVGPVFWLDLIRTTRRSRLFKVRVVYLGVILLGLLQMYGSWRRSFPLGPGPGELARFSLSLFYVFLVVQLLALLLITPALTAGTVAEERERGSLAFLLATDLRDHEIILGKFASRLVYLLALLLAGVPVFALLQLLGGIDLGLVLLCFAGTLLTVGSVAGVSLLASVLSRRTRDAVILAYGIVFAYLGLAVVFEYAVQVNELTTFPSTDTWKSPVELSDLVRLVNVGHPVAVLRQVASTSSGAVLLGVLGSYAVFHLLVIAACLGLSLILLRRVGLADGEPAATVQKPGKAPPPVRPDRVVGDQPVLWRETGTERGLNANPWAHLQTALGIVAVLAVLDWKSITSWATLTREINLPCRLMSALLASMILLQVVLRAASGIRLERERDTLDGLLVTPLSAREILHGKWVGALYSVPMLGTGLLTVWLVGLVTGGLHPLAILGQALFTAVFMMLFAALGLYVSLTTDSALRATITAVGAAMLVSFGHWFLWIPLLPTLTGPPGPFTWLGHLVSLQVLLTPPVSLGLAWGFPLLEVRQIPRDLWVYLKMAPLALLIGCLATWVIRRVTLRKFRAMFHRE